MAHHYPHQHTSRGPSFDLLDDFSNEFNQESSHLSNELNQESSHLSGDYDVNSHMIPPKVNRVASFSSKLQLGLGSKSDLTR